MHSGLEFFSRRSPNKTAVIMGERALTFTELNARANRVAHALAASGIAKGDRVGAWLDNCIEYPEIIFGCSKAGAVLVPINYRLTGREAHPLLRHARVKLVFVNERLRGALEPFKDDLPDLAPPGLIAVGAQQYEQWLDGQPEKNPEIDIDERDPFYIGFTSGTTGVPKGALVPHRARALLMLANAVEYGLTEDDINLTPGAIYHAAPIIYMLLGIWIGGTSVIMGHFDAAEMLRLIEAHGVTNAFVAPTMLHMIHHLPEDARERHRLDSVRVLISAGAPLSTADKEATRNLFGAGVLHEFYGSTEAGWNINLRPCDLMRKPRSCGKPTLGWEVKLLDDDGEEVTEPGQVGEIFVRGEYMFDGYIDNPEATAAAFRGDWFSAGDLGQFDEEGYYYIVGRKKDMIISGGANVYPEEVEECLHDFDKIADVAVIGVPDETWGERVQAVVTLKDGAESSAEEIMGFCDGRIAGFKKPRQVRFVDEIPRNPSGKILKNVLREQVTQAGPPAAGA